jgi:hypothetical protein
MHGPISASSLPASQCEEALKIIQPRSEQRAKCEQQIRTYFRITQHVKQYDSERKESRTQSRDRYASY